MTNLINKKSLEEKSKEVNKFMSDLVVFSKYAGIVKGEHRKQSWDECVTVYRDMLIEDHPQLKDEIIENFKLVYEKKVFPSMRSMQYGGEPISFNPTRIYNCSALAIDSVASFHEYLWILLSGAGIGISLQKCHTDNLPIVHFPQKSRRFLISDSIEGWADAVRALCNAYFKGHYLPEFDYRDIRPEGSPIRKLNCLAPGPRRLSRCLSAVRQIFNNAIGRKLTSIELLDIFCYIAECVVSGGIRSSAVIVLFDKEDKFIANAKREIKISSANLLEETETEWKILIQFDDKEILHGKNKKIVVLDKSFGDYDKNRILNDHYCQWYYLHPQRGMSNNSVVLHRDTTTEEEFRAIMKNAYETGSGEPGIFWTNDYNVLTNPCFSGNCRLLTSRGYVRMKDLYEQQGFNFYNPNTELSKYGTQSIINTNGKVSATNVYMTSKMNHLYRVTLSNGMEEEVTLNHNWIVLGDKGKKIRKKTSELSMSDKIILPNFERIFKGEEKQFRNLAGKTPNPKFNIDVHSAFAFFLGLVMSNGTATSDEYTITITFKTFNDESIKEKISEHIEILNSIIHSQSCNQKDNLLEYEIIFDYKIDYLDFFSMFDEKKLDSLLTLSNKETIVTFLNSYIGSFGNISINRDKALIKIWDNNKKFLQDVQLLLSTLDIYSNIVMHRPKKTEKDITRMIGNNVVNHIEGYDLLITGYHYVNKFVNEIGCVYKYKEDKIKELLPLMNKNSVEKQSHLMTYVKPIAIEYIGKEPTYCLTEFNNHELIVNGLVIGNCGEISLRSGQFCNLTTINAYDIESQEEFNKRAKVAAFIGTLQATYTNFHYLRPFWQETTEEDALLGVSLTGIASGKILKLNEKEAAEEACKENERISSRLGIKKALRVTTIKPEGTTTLVAGVFGAGVHAAHAEYYIRNIRVRKTDPIYSYLKEKLPDFIAQDYMDEDKEVLSIPMKANSDCIFRTEPTIDLLERIKRLSINWIQSGHRGGANHNNVSSTVSVREGEIEMVTDWMWKNKDFYNGITILPYHGGTYKQAPYQDITEEEYYKMLEKFPSDLNLKDVYVPDIQHVSRESACSANGCDITSLS